MFFTKKITHKNLIVFFAAKAIFVGSVYSSQEESQIISRSSFVVSKYLTNFTIYEDYIPDQQFMKIELKINDRETSSCDRADEFGDTPLHRAVDQNNVDLVEDLLKKGASSVSLNEFDETPILQALKKYDQKMLSAFASYGNCYLINHSDFVIPDLSVSSLFKNNAERFYEIIDEGFHVKNVVSVMSTLHAMFDAMYKNREICHEGKLITINGIDCLVQMKMFDLIQMFGPVVDKVKDIVDLYSVSNDFIVKANGLDYVDTLCHILATVPQLCFDPRFNHYIMYKLLMNSNRKKDRWNLLFMKGFDPNARPRNCSLSIMHFAVLSYNEVALVALVNNGANYLIFNEAEQTPIDLLIYSASGDGYVCLTAVKNALEDRARQKNFYYESIQLCETADMITRWLKSVGHS